MGGVGGTVVYLFMTNYTISYRLGGQPSNYLVIIRFIDLSIIFTVELKNSFE